MRSNLSLSDLKSSTLKTDSRSSGPGGQNVNKTASKVQLTFFIKRSMLLPGEKALLLLKYSKGEIQVVNQETRSQHQNTFLAYENLRQKINQGLIILKKRKKTVAFHRTKQGKKAKSRNDHLRKYRERDVA